MKVTVCFTYFRSLSLKNLEASLFSVRQQDMSNVECVIVVDNDTEDSTESIQAVINALEFPVMVRLLSFKHGDPLRTHAWSTNMAVRVATTPWILFSRADYLLSFNLLQKFTSAVVVDKGFITSNGCHLSVDVLTCEQSSWRVAGLGALRNLPGVEFDYTCIDAGVWMIRRSCFDDVDGLDETLTAWGHAQTHFQWKLHKAGVGFVRIPETLFYHPHHAAPRDIELAHQQLRDRGIDLYELWARYDGNQPYEKPS